MSNHNLFTFGANGAYEIASTEQILAAARKALAHRDYLAARLGHLEHEIFGVILLNQRHKVIKCVELFRGTIDGASVYPREVVKLALQEGAAACVLFHNHPSGVKDQSNADEAITETLKAALALISVRVLDHLIIAADKMLSFSERGLI